MLRSDAAEERSGAFAHVPGANLAAALAALTVGRADLVGPKEVRFPPRNRILRDIDGARDVVFIPPDV